MRRRMPTPVLPRLLAALILAATPSAALAQRHSAARPTRGAAAASQLRAIRRDIPMTDMIRRALAAGTRDSSGRPGPRYWQLWMDYTIQARLDPATSTVTGRETAVIHNTSPNPMVGVALRLDQNIFAPTAERGQSVPPTMLTDGMKITRMTLDGAVVELNPAPPVFRPGAPPPPRPTVPQLRGSSETSARILLPTPIAPGATATLEAEWSFRVPLVVSGRGIRMGREADSVFQVAQWYPRVAVFDDLRQDGWDREPYLGSAEFYNNFGRFDLSIDVPAGWVVGATGVLQNPDDVLPAAARERLSHVLESDSVRRILSASELPGAQAGAGGDRRVWHFVADTVGDVAWAASNRYVWDATRATIPGRGPVPVYLLYMPGDTAEFAGAAEATRHALEFYSKLWMPYAFPKLTLADGPELGMEYPQFIMSARGAADHETGHEWWPMMVGTNETWYGWMDEGFNQYMNILSAADREGRGPLKAASAHEVDLDGQGQAYGQLAGNEELPPLMWNANDAGPMYAIQTYGVAPMMLSMLGGVVGDSAVQRAMSEYAHAWRFKHPSPWDYAFFMSNALHRDLGWFWYYWLFTTERVDGSIQSVATTGTRSTVTVRQDGQMPSPVVLKVQLAPSGGRIRTVPDATMLDATTALVTYPVDVWFGGSRTFTTALDFGRPIRKITLDPYCRFPDHDATDNVWPRQPAPAVAQATSMRRMRAVCTTD